MTDRDLNHWLDALARTLRRIARATTRLRRSAAVDAQRLVDLEGTVDGTLRLLQSLQREIGEGNGSARLIATFAQTSRNKIG